MKRLRVESINGTIKVELCDNFPNDAFEKVWQDVIDKADVSLGALSTVKLMVKDGHVIISSTYKRSIPLPVKESADLSQTKIGKGDLCFGLDRTNYEVYLSSCFIIITFVV